VGLASLKENAQNLVLALSALLHVRTQQESSPQKARNGASVDTRAGSTSILDFPDFRTVVFHISIVAATIECSLWYFC
jgi:hypothetical protein